MAQCQGHRAQMVKLFWCLPVIFDRKILQKSQGVRGPTQCKSGRAITWFIGVTIYCTFFNNTSPPPRRFSCTKILLKKIRYSKGNAHWTNFWIETVWAPWPHMYSYDWLFSWQNNNLWGKYSTGLLFTAKILQEVMYFTSLTWAKSLTKLNPKMHRWAQVR